MHIRWPLGVSADFLVKYWVLLLPLNHIDVLDLTYHEKIMKLLSATEHTCGIIIPKKRTHLVKTYS